MPDYDTREEKVLEAFKDFAVADSNRHKDLRATPPGRVLLHYYSRRGLPIGGKSKMRTRLHYSDRTKFSASGGMKPEAWHSNNETVLHVIGMQVDSIAVLGSEPAFTKAIAVFEINMAKVSALKQSFLWLQEC
jgi:hypothetical protein